MSLNLWVLGSSPIHHLPLATYRLTLAVFAPELAGFHHLGGVRVVVLDVSQGLSSVTWKSSLKSVRNEDSHGNVHPMRYLNACRGVASALLCSRRHLAR